MQQTHAASRVAQRAIMTLVGTLLSTLAACTTSAEWNGGAGTQDSSGTIVALPPTDHVDLMAREPMLAEALDGTLYISGYGEDFPVLWRSTDGGARWERVNVGTAADGAVGNSDVDLAIAADGTLYLIVMTYDRAKQEGRGIAVGSSRDDGASWRWTALSRDRFDDRPWIEVAPDGTAHAIWNDGQGVSHAVSVDRGLTWSERARVAPRGMSSHLAIGPAGAIAVRITPLSASANRFDVGVDSLAISTDGGVSWTLRGLPGARAWSAYDERSPMLRWVEPVAWDSANALYSLWSEGTSLRVARSSDSGVSWTTVPVARGSDSLYFPYLVARGNGELGMTWFSGLGTRVRANVAHLHFDERIADTLGAVPASRYDFASFQRANTDTTDRDTSDVARERDTAGEYAAVLFLRDGRLATVTTIQDLVGKRYGFTFRPYRIE